MEILFRLIKPGTEFVLSMLTFQGGYFFFPFSPPIALLQPQGGGAAQPLVLTEMDGGQDVKRHLGGVWSSLPAAMAPQRLPGGEGDPLLPVPLCRHHFAVSFATDFSSGGQHFT